MSCAECPVCPSCDDAPTYVPSCAPGPCSPCGLKIVGPAGATGEPGSNASVYGSFYDVLGNSVWNKFEDVPAAINYDLEFEFLTDFCPNVTLSPDNQSITLVGASVGSSLPMMIIGFKFSNDNPGSVVGNIFMITDPLEDVYDTGKWLNQNIYTNSTASQAISIPGNSNRSYYYMMLTSLNVKFRLITEGPLVLERTVIQY